MVKRELKFPKMPLTVWPRQVFWPFWSCLPPPVQHFPRGIIVILNEKSHMQNTKQLVNVSAWLFFSSWPFFFFFLSLSLEITLDFLNIRRIAWNSPALILGYTFGNPSTVGGLLGTELQVCEGPGSICPHPPYTMPPPVFAGTSGPRNVVLWPQWATVFWYSEH